jgi:hypothetical protein
MGAARLYLASSHNREHVVARRLRDDRAPSFAVRHRVFTEDSAETTMPWF